ncbi:hypothetical protein F511_36524 [Dorcoceras hygrometricum]|uniref:Uncharacterized protein n=1 Tax=Dorcoceras hygrometricum TaxID=472368 RepID=A0A2Z7D756_9LAMI|nr:hypothetical protein F511_36524 [Dorcoceras hygrometricum]
MTLHPLMGLNIKSVHVKKARNPTTVSYFLEVKKFIVEEEKLVAKENMKAIE